jgi:hypothetical protein
VQFGSAVFSCRSTSASTEGFHAMVFRCEGLTATTKSTKDTKLESPEVAKRTFWLKEGSMKASF